MKIFVLLSIICIVAVSGQSPGGFGFNDAACLQQTKASVDAIQAYQESREFDPNDHKLKCMLTCAFSKFGVINENGEFNAQKMVEQILKEDDDSSENEEKVANLLQIFKNCDNSKVVGDYCEKGFFAVNCVYSLN